MKNDISEIPVSGCNYMTGATTLINRSGNVYKTFTLIGNKWVNTRQTESNYPDNSYKCLTLSELPFAYEQFEPLYLTNALLISVLVIVSAGIIIFGGLLRRWQ